MQANFANLEAQGRKLIAAIVTEIEGAGHYVVEHINFTKLEEVALAAYLRGGKAAVLPALIDQVVAFVDPNAVGLVIAILKIALAFA